LAFGTDNDLTHKTGLQTDIPTISYGALQTKQTLNTESQIVSNDGRWGRKTAYLKSLEDRNTKLKRLLSDTLLDNVLLKDLLGKN